jgi:hypothetical protein
MRPIPNHVAYLMPTRKAAFHNRCEVQAAGGCQTDLGVASAIFNAATRSAKSSLLKLT